MLIQRSRLSSQTSLFLVFGTLLVIYEIVAYLGVYVVDLKGASVDALKFHELANEWAGDPAYAVNIGVHFYVQLLGTLYYLVTPHQFVGAQLSIVAILLSAYKLHTYLVSQRVTRTSLILLLIFLWPSLLPRAGTTMREPLMILATVYLVTELSHFVQRGAIVNLIKAILGGLGLFLLHKATGLITVVVLGYACVYTAIFARSTFQSRLYLYSGVSVLVASLVIFITMFSELREMRVFSNLLQGEMVNLDQMLDMKYEKAAAVSRAAYSAPVSFSDPVRFVGSLVISAWHFTFQPFPNRIENVFDVYAFVEVVFRTCFIAYILLYRNWLAKGHRFMFGAFWIISLVWASGTTNYGTASRHQLVGFWILVVLFALIRATKRAARDLVVGEQPTIDQCKEVDS